MKSPFKKMNLLFLSNSARNYYKFFNSLADEFSDDGNEVVFAVDSTFAYCVNRLESKKFEVYNFEKFFSSHITDSTILQQHSDRNLSAMLLADFERGQFFNHWQRKPVEFYEKLKSALLTFFTEIIDKHSIDAVIFEDVANSFAYFSLCICEKRNVNYIGLTSSRLPGRFSVTSNPLLNHIKIQRKLNSIKNEDLQPDNNIVNWSKQYLENIDKVEPDYMSFNGLDSTSLKSFKTWSERLHIWKYSILLGFRSSTYAFSVGNPLKRRFSVMRRTVARRIRSKKLNRYYSLPKEGDCYLLYPLHYHPEASTSVLSGTYLNEYEVIRNIAFNLPEGILLYVKDHRSAYGFPELSFYETVSRLPNVKIIEPFAQTKKLIRNCVAVITLTSTVGYEALLIGKKVFLFGNVFYQFHPDIIKIKDPSTLFQILKENVNKKCNADKNYNLEFIQAYYLSTLSGKLNMSSEKSDDIARKLYPEIKSHLAEICKSLKIS